MVERLTMFGGVGMKHKPLRVLVADDCNDAADSLVMLVNLWKHETRVAYDGAAALAIAGDFQPDVLLLDIAMPKLDGFKLAQQLRRQGPCKNALMIALTGYADAPHRLLWENAFDHFLIKPADPTIIANLLLYEQRRLSIRTANRATPRALGIQLATEEVLIASAPAGANLEEYSRLIAH